MIGLKSGTYLGEIEKISSANGIIAGITTYPEKIAAEQLHYHETLHLSFVLSGGNLEKRTQNDIERLPGVVTFYDAGEPHCSTETIPFSRHINVEIEAAFLKRHGFNTNAMNLHFLKSPDAKFFMLKIFNELQAEDIFSEASTESLVLGLLAITKQQNWDGTPPGWIKLVHEFIRDRQDRPLSLSDLSGVAEVHPVTLSKYFPRYFGCSVGEYLRKIKVERALLLMETSSLSLTAISNACGFADQSHFIRTFKTQTGLLPKHYQKLYHR